MLGNDMIHTGTAAGGAYQFPEAASLRISFSSVKSETARRNCLFSVSSSLSRFFEAVSWFALLGPRGTPAPILIKLHREITKIAALSDIREKFAQLGLDTIVGSPEELAVIIKSDIVKWAKVIDDAGIKAEE